jgi:hypothetical protein
MTLPDEGSGMKRDSEVLLMRRERAKGRTQEQAAARAGMSVRTIRRYERRGKCGLRVTKAWNTPFKRDSQNGQRTSDTGRAEEWLQGLRR